MNQTTQTYMKNYEHIDWNKTDPCVFQPMVVYLLLSTRHIRHSRLSPRYHIEQIHWLRLVIWKVRRSADLTSFLLTLFLLAFDELGCPLFFLGKSRVSHLQLRSTSNCMAGSRCLSYDLLRAHKIDLAESSDEALRFEQIVVYRCVLFFSGLWPMGSFGLAAVLRNSTPGGERAFSGDGVGMRATCEELVYSNLCNLIQVFNYWYFYCKSVFIWGFRMWFM